MKHGTIIHELIHGLGFWHEISRYLIFRLIKNFCFVYELMEMNNILLQIIRPDRDEYIYVKQDNVLPGMKIIVN